MDKILSEKEAAREKGFSAWTWRRLRLEYGLPFIKIGSRFFYNMASVDKYFAECEKTGDKAKIEATPEFGTLRRVQ